MKKILLFSVVALMGVTLQAQFITQNSNTTESLYEVQFLNENVGYVVGDNGTILKTTNGGNTWENLNNSNTSIELNSLYFVNENVGYVLGSEWDTVDKVTLNIFLKTVDGGNTWTELKVKGGLALSDVFFINEDTGFVTSYSRGEGEGIYRTIDGGVSWEFINVEKEESNVPYRIAFYDENVGYVAFRSDIYKTEDGGLNWSLMDVPNFCTFFNAIHILNKDTAFFGCNYFSGIVLTQDKGVTNEIITRDIAVGDMVFFSEQFGYALFAYSRGGEATLYRTSDSGKNWTAINNEKLLINNLYFTDENNGWIVGEDGLILYYSPTLGNDKELFLENEVTIHPNPSFSEINIKVSKNINVLKMSLYDISGRLVFEKETATMISLKNFNSGNYFLKIQTDKGVINKKIIKK